MASAGAPGRGVLSIMALAWLCVWITTSGCRKEAPAPMEAVRPAKTMLVSKAYAAGGRSYPGEVRPNEEADLAFNVPGQLIEFPVKRGDQVKAGALLAKLDPRDFENQLAKAIAAEAEAKVTRDRFAKAVESGAASKQMLTEAEAKLEIASSQVRIERKALEDTEIHAPYDGRATDKFVENFEHVQAKQKILSFQTTDVVKAVFNIPERDVAFAPSRDNLGRFVARFAFLPGREFEMELKEFVGEADAATQTYAVSLIMPAPKDVNLAPGMTVQIVWYPPTADAAGSGFVIPATSVFENPEGQTCVWIVDPQTSTVKETPVTTGKLTGDDIVVTGGLEDGQRVVTAGVSFLREGMQIRVMEPQSKDQAE